MDELEIKCGIKYNKDLIKKWKDIDSTLLKTMTTRVRLSTVNLIQMMKNVNQMS